MAGRQLDAAAACENGSEDDKWPETSLHRLPEPEEDPTVWDTMAQTPYNPDLPSYGVMTGTCHCLLPHIFPGSIHER